MSILWNITDRCHINRTYHWDQIWPSASSFVHLTEKGNLPVDSKLAMPAWHVLHNYLEMQANRCCIYAHKHKHTFARWFMVACLTLANLLNQVPPHRFDRDRFFRHLSDRSFLIVPIIAAQFCIYTYTPLDSSCQAAWKILHFILVWLLPLR